MLEGCKEEQKHLKTLEVMELSVLNLYFLRRGERPGDWIVRIEFALRPASGMKWGSRVFFSGRRRLRGWGVVQKLVFAEAVIFNLLVPVTWSGLGRWRENPGRLSHGEVRELQPPTTLLSTL